MCGAIAYQQRKIYFPNPHAQLPVRLKGGDIAWQPWGRRNAQTGQLPAGGWARLESIKAGRWAAYQPRPVVIMAQAYMEKDPQRQSHWFDLAVGEAIQGLLAVCQNEQRVYVVTIAAPTIYAPIHDRWPRIVQLISEKATS